MNNTDAPPTAFIKHQLPGRVRLKIPEKRSDFAYFDRLGKLFADCKDIAQLQLNPPAASILICHNADAPFQTIIDFAETNRLFQLTEKPNDDESFMLPNLPIATLGSLGLDRIDESLLDFSKNRLDTRSLLFLALLGMGLHQIFRGNLVAPAATFLWYALELLEHENGMHFDIEDNIDIKR